MTRFPLGKYAAAKAQADELVALADEKGALYWKALEQCFRVACLALTGRRREGVSSIISGDRSRPVNGATSSRRCFVVLARAYAELGQFDDAWRCIGEAMAGAEASGERWCEAEIHRTAGEIELMSPERDTAKAQAHFERALEIARAQQARSWELRAATSLARLWRDQGRRAEAHDLLAPVYGWFTEGFDTLDLKEAKALLEELA